MLPSSLSPNQIDPRTYRVESLASASVQDASQIQNYAGGNQRSVHQHHAVSALDYERFQGRLADKFVRELNEPAFFFHARALNEKSQLSDQRPQDNIFSTYNSTDLNTDSAQRSPNNQSTTRTTLRHSQDTNRMLYNNSHNIRANRGPVGLSSTRINRGVIPQTSIPSPTSHP